MAIFRVDGEKPKVEYSVHKATPEELAEHHSYVERSERLPAMRPELMQKYPDQWVALTESGAFLVASSIDELVAKTHAIGDRSGFSAWAFLSTKPRRRVIL